MSKPETKTLHPTDQEREKNQAFDLLDSLTKSGVLTIDYVSLHVIITATHCFDKSVMETVIKNNVNPIEKLENSTLILATTIHQTDVENMLVPSQLALHGKHV